MTRWKTGQQRLDLQIIKDHSKLEPQLILLCTLVGVIALPQACHNICVHPLKLTSVVALTVLAFEADKMIGNIAHFPAILAINITCCGVILLWHRLHSNSRIKKSKIFAHILGALFAERTCVAVPSHVLKQERCIT